MTDFTNSPAIVVGAGPAGASAAWHLASNGIPVVLVDKARFPRDKACGDGLTGGAFAELHRLGIAPDDIPTAFHVGRANFVSPRGHSVALDTGASGGGPWLGAVARAEFDSLLVDRAVAAGAQLMAGLKVIGGARTGDRVEVRMEDGESMHGRALIAADGAWSSVRRSVEGPASALSKWQATRLYLEGVDGPAADEAFVWFDPDLLPGYAWSFPLGGGRVNVGVGALRTAGDGGGWIVRRTHELVDARGTDVLGAGAQPVGRPVAWPIPTDFHRSRLSALEGLVLFTGDAVGATDPMTGEGIAEALLTGRLAAEAVASGRPGSYVELAHKALGGRHRRRSRCSRLLRSPALAHLGLRVADLGPWSRRQFTGWVFS